MGNVYESHNVMSEICLEIVLGREMWVGKSFVGQACDGRVLSTLFLSVVYV